MKIQICAVALLCVAMFSNANAQFSTAKTPPPKATSPQAAEEATEAQVAPNQITQQPIDQGVILNNPTLDPSLQRYRMMTVGETTFMLDRVSGDTWYLVNDGQKPRWESVLRPAVQQKKQAASQPPTRSDDKVDAEAKSEKSKSAESKPESKSLFNGPAVAGPVDVHLIKGLDIVVVRGPKASVQAVKDAVKQMGQDWNAPKAKIIQAETEVE